MALQSCLAVKTEVAAKKCRNQVPDSFALRFLSSWAGCPR